MTTSFTINQNDIEENIDTEVTDIPWPFTFGNYTPGGLDTRSLTLTNTPSRGSVFRADLIYHTQKNLTFQYRRNYTVYFNS